jgi:SAM-dependent methyltransferase
LSSEATGAAALWGSADYKRLAERFAPIHDELVERLAPAVGIEWLDVATGTGAVALRAARAGATVTGLDISPDLIEVAKANAGTLPVTFDLGDAQALPYADQAFDVVSSCFGAIFAPDHSAVAAELHRVCRGRLGLMNWVPIPQLWDVFARFEREPPEGRDMFEWGKAEYVESLLGADFDLEIEEKTWILEGADGEELYQLWFRAAPPYKATIESFDDVRREEFKREYIEYCEQYRQGDRVAVPRPYLLVLGKRR